MRLQSLRPESHAPTCPPSCASERWAWSLLNFKTYCQVTDRVPVKGNCVDSGPSLVAETLSRLLLSYQIGYCMQNIILWVSTFLVEHGVPPAGGSQILSDSLTNIFIPISLTNIFLQQFLYIVSYNFYRQVVQKGPFSISEFVHIRFLMHLRLFS